MSNLDDKLREIYLTIDECPESKVCGTCIKLADDFVAQIKQAFADDGYVQIPQVEVVTRWEAGKKPEVFMVNGKEVMTGQEWFEKFVYALLEDGTYEEGDTKDLDEVMDAARKAAGMTT